MYEQNGYFWLVWTPDHPTTPKKRWSSKVSATNEAKKLAMKFPDRDFYVIKAVSKHTVKQIVTNTCYDQTLV